MQVHVHEKLATREEKNQEGRKEGQTKGGKERRGIHVHVQVGRKDGRRERKSGRKKERRLMGRKEVMSSTVCKSKKYMYI